MTQGKRTIRGATAGVLLALGTAVLGVPRIGAAQEGPQRSTPPTLAFVTNNPSDYWTICRKGCERAARKLPGVHLRFVMPPDGTAATQKQDVDDLIAAGVRGIAVSPVDPAGETSALNTWAAKVPLITSDSDAPNSNRLCYIGTDNHAAGLMAGRLIRQALPHGGQIMLFVGLATAQNAHDRISGIRDALQGSRVRILGVLTDDTDHARAKANAADTLAKYPHIAGLVGIWSYNGPAILNAVQDASKIGRVKIVCFDEEQETLNGIKRGAISATVVQQPYLFGYRSIQMLARLAQGDQSALPPGHHLIIPTLAITRRTLGAYEAQRAQQMAQSD